MAEPQNISSSARAVEAKICHGSFGKGFQARLKDFLLPGLRRSSASSRHAPAVSVLPSITPFLKRTALCGCIVFRTSRAQISTSRFGRPWSGPLLAPAPPPSLFVDHCYPSQVSRATYQNLYRLFSSLLSRKGHTDPEGRCLACWPVHHHL
jgi:hypothetical protein